MSSAPVGIKSQISYSSASLRFWPESNPQVLPTSSTDKVTWLTVGDSYAVLPLSDFIGVKCCCFLYNEVLRFYTVFVSTGWALKQAFFISLTSRTWWARTIPSHQKRMNSKASLVPMKATCLEYVCSMALEDFTPMSSMISRPKVPKFHKNP